MKKLIGLLTGVGAVNWLLVGLFDWNLVEFVFRTELLITIVYVLVGLSGIIFLVKMCSCCGSSSCKTCDSAPVSSEDSSSDEEEVQM